MQPITKEQLTALKAVAKKSAERASQSLSKLINIPVKLEMTQARIMEVQRLPKLLASPEEHVSVVFLPVTGDGTGSSILVSSLQEVPRLVELITKQPQGSLIKLDDAAISVFKETANIIGGAFLSALSDMTDISFMQSVPQYSANTMKKVMDIAITQLNHKDSGLSIAFEIDFELSTTTTTTTTTTKIITHYIFLLKVDLAQKLLEALEKKQSVSFYG